MSIKEMIAEHPMSKGGNDPLAEVARHAMYCAAICNACADACAGEADAGERGHCIRLCNDCSDICTATYRLASRRTGDNAGVMRALLQACITACEACADMCEGMSDAHCKRCARMCRECAADCKKALDAM